MLSILIIIGIIIFALKSDDISKEKKDESYHPTTTYKGTKSQMDAYIRNREKKLKQCRN